jgi:hypothetical protein
LCGAGREGSRSAVRRPARTHGSADGLARTLDVARPAEDSEPGRTIIPLIAAVWATSSRRTLTADAVAIEFPDQPNVEPDEADTGAEEHCSPLQAKGFSRKTTPAARNNQNVYQTLPSTNQTPSKPTPNAAAIAVTPHPMPRVRPLQIAFTR